MLIKKLVRFHEILESIVIDRDSLFNSSFYFSLYYVLKIKRKLFIIFYSQINDQIERQNSIMEQYLRAHVNFTQNNWVSLFSITKFVYNSVEHVSITMSLFEINIDYNSRKCYKKKSNSKFKAPTILNHAKKLQRVNNTLRDILRFAQQT